MFFVDAAAGVGQFCDAPGAGQFCDAAVVGQFRDAAGVDQFCDAAGVGQFCAPATRPADGAARRCNTLPLWPPYDLAPMVPGFLWVPMPAFL